MEHKNDSREARYIAQGYRDVLGSVSVYNTLDPKQFLEKEVIEIA